MTEDLPASSEAVEPTAPDDAAAFPWPPRAGESVVAAFVRTWRRSVLEPARFFRGLPPGGGLGAPLLYYLVVGVAAAGIGLFWRSAFTLAAGAVADLAWGFMPRARVGWLDVASFLLAPILLAVTLALVACLLHVSLWVLGGARKRLRRTFHALCFTNGPALFAVVPLLGAWVGAVWGLVLVVIALREAHEIETWRAVAALLLPLVLLFGVGIAAVVTGVLVGSVLLGWG